MAEIWNLSALCRCCHEDGIFRSLQTPYMFENNIEIYSVLLHDTFGIDMDVPKFEASYTICNMCVQRLRDASQFKKQVLICERKFEEYLKNEQAFCQFMKSSENVKIELDSVNCENNFNKTTLDYKNEDDFDVGMEGKHDVDMTFDGQNDDEVKGSIEIKKEDDTTKIEISIDTSEFNNTEAAATGPKKSKPPKKPKDKIPDEEIDPTLLIQVKTDNGELYTCKLCGGSYKEVMELKQHVFNTHTRCVYDCELCDKKFKTITSIKRHQKTHDRQYKCRFCEKSFHKKQIMLEHLNTHTRQKIFKCDICQKQFLYKQTLRKHIKWHQGLNRKYICDICGRSSNDNTNLMIHIMTVHKKVRPFSCDVCQKRFSAKKHLTVHVRNHTGERPFQCDICLKGFTCFTRMKRHRIMHEDNKYLCKMCKKVFSDRGLFASHVRSHGGHKPFRCHMCDKDFSCRFSLKRHITDHYGIKRFLCDICEKRFTQKTQLNRHMKRLHNPKTVVREKVKCEICKKAVYDKEKHMNAHNNKIYNCDLCDKSYSERNTLNRHRKKHSGIKPHQCDLCDKKYVQSNSLKNHKIKVHKYHLKKEDEENFDSMLTKYTICKQDKT